jgi:hypothetical protein
VGDGDYAPVEEAAGHLRYSEHLDVEGVRTYADACKLELEAGCARGEPFRSLLQPLV